MSDAVRRWQGAMLRPLPAFSFLALSLIGSAATAAVPVADPAALVNPFIGTAVSTVNPGPGQVIENGYGYTYPGAVVPFGMVAISPDTIGSNKKNCGGYLKEDLYIQGFGQNH